MTNHYSTTILTEHKPGQHLGPEERGTIQALKKLVFSNRAISRVIGCSPSTVGYELKRGSPEYSGRGRKPSYSAKRGDAVYRQNIISDKDFSLRTNGAYRSFHTSIDN